MNEADFAYRVRLALDEGAARVDYTVALRLEKARRLALERAAARDESGLWVPALQLGSASGTVRRGTDSRRWAWMLRFGMAVPLVALALAIVGIKQWQSDRTIAEVADIDFAVLMDDTPIDTYADKGFGVMLRNETDM